jgi:hypothetical protein
MHYRYPPLFLLMFAPLAALPLGLAAGLWVACKVAALIAIILALRKRAVKAATASSIVVAVLFIAPYIIEDFRYGNAQFFVVALTIAALWFVRKRPLIAAASLALGISIKVWPAFFLPYLLVRRDWKPVAWTLVFVLVLALVPATYFGWSGNLSLLGQWYRQEIGTQLGESEIWFPKPVTPGHADAISDCHRLLASTRFQIRRGKYCQFKSCNCPHNLARSGSRCLCRFSLFRKSQANDGRLA